MKKLFAISFLFIYLFSTTELSQLLKVPLLIEHYIEHRETNNQFTLIEFLFFHYAVDHGQDDDHENDLELPFKSHHNCVNSFLNVYLPPEKISIENPIRFVEKEIYIKKSRVLITSFIANIWQPPRLAEVV